MSYYTGKLETYLRYKGLAYKRANPYADAARIRAAVGVIQHPIIEREDGRWMSDTTPIILQLEREHPAPSVLPTNPVVQFVARLIEDYADEWLWRAAMHYRWSYEHDRELLSRILTDELTQHISAPRFVRRRMIKRRQRHGFVNNDGVTDSTRDHVEAGYLNALAGMTQALQGRPYVLGDSPSIADFGLMGPMLRHFGQDPTPAAIMRDQAPSVFAWVARMWQAQPKTSAVNFLHDVPADLNPLLEELCDTHLVQLASNAQAWHSDQRLMTMTIQGCAYQNIPVSRYRVWCLEQLRQAFNALSAEHQQSVRALLPWSSANVLWDEVEAASGYDAEQLAPFNQAIHVFAGGVPS